jgi:hypothetical protein
MFNFFQIQAQMKTFHGKRVMELKRQLTHRQPYGQASEQTVQHY